MVNSLPTWARDAALSFVPRCEAPGEPAAKGVFWRAAPGWLHFELPDIARYLVRAGTSIEIEPLGSVPTADIARYLVTTPLAALALQRGLLVLHAAAAERDGRVVVIAGELGTGKSIVLDA